MEAVKCPQSTKCETVHMTMNMIVFGKNGEKITLNDYLNNDNHYSQGSWLKYVAG